MLRTDHFPELQHDGSDDGWGLEIEGLLKIFLRGSNIMDISQPEVLAIMDHYYEMAALMSPIELN